MPTPRVALETPPRPGPQLPRWLLPAALVVLFLGIGVFVAALLWFAQASLESSPAFAHGLARARASEAVRQALGAPLDTGFPTGSVLESDGQLEYAVEVALKGPKGEGVLRVQATERGGVWTYERVEVELSPGQRVELRAPPQAQPDVPAHR